MTTRTSRSALAFSRTMKLKAGDGEQPLGTSPAATDEEALAALARDDANREVMTFLHIQRGGASHLVTVSAADLEMLFHDGVLMPLDSVDRRDAKQ